MRGMLPTPVRVWKVAQLAGHEQRGGGVRAVLRIVRTLLQVLLSGCEVAVIPLSANMHAMAALWRHSSFCHRCRRRRSNDKRLGGVAPADDAERGPALAAASAAAAAGLGGGSTGSRGTKNGCGCLRWGADKVSVSSWELEAGKESPDTRTAATALAMLDSAAVLSGQVGRALVPGCWYGRLVALLNGRITQAL
jgi:hypothetical protein